MRKGERETLDFFFFHPAMSMQSHHHHPSYFLTPPNLLLICEKQHLLQQTALSEGMMDEEELPPPLSERGSGEGDSVDHTLYTSGDVGQEDRSFLKKAGIQQERENIFEKLF